MAIQIITDSAADYSAQELERRNVICVPMSVTFGTETWRDGVDLTKEAFYEKLETRFPQTSQPSPAAFLEQFEKIKERGDTAIVILVSGALSGTVQSAQLAKNMAEYENIHIIDSRSVSLGMRILTDRAVILRRRGCTAEEIVSALEKLRERVRIYAGLDTLEYLVKGGRISRSAGSVGKLVNVKPTVTLTREGSVALIGKQLGLRRAYRQLAGILAKDPPDYQYPVYFLYARDRKNCFAFARYLRENGVEFGELKIRGIGPTIGSHIGPGAFGIAYVSKGEAGD